MTKFNIGDKVRYVSDDGSIMGTGVVTAIDTYIEASFTRSADGFVRGTRTFHRDGRGTGHRGGQGSDPNSCLQLIEPAVAKRTVYLVQPGLVSPTESLQEASNMYHKLRSDRDRVIIQMEQQSDRKGGVWKTVNIAGPVEPLPRVTKVSRCFYLATDGLPRMDRWIGQEVEFEFNGTDIVGVRLTGRKNVSEDPK